MSAWRQWRAPMALVALATLFACLKGRSPTELGANDVRFSLVAQVSGGGSALHVTVNYLDKPDVPVALLDQTLTVAPGTANVPLTIDLTRCLADANHLSAGSTCELVTTVVLLQGGTAVDSVTIGPVVVTPGEVLRDTTSVTAVGHVDVYPPTLSLTIGAIGILKDTVFGANGAPIPNATVTWASADTNVAKVNQNGAVTGIATGTTSVSASANGQKDSAVVTVSSTGGGGLTPNIGAVSFSAPQNGTLPANGYVTISSTDTAVVTGLAATVTYGSGASGWLNANVSDSGVPSIVVKRPRGFRAAIVKQTSSGVSTPGTLDLVPNTTALSPGVYTATVVITGNGAQETSVGVTYTISSNASIVLTPNGLTDTVTAGGAAVTKKVVVTNGGTGTLSGLSDTISYGSTTGWLSVSQTSTTSPDTLSVIANPSSLTAGTYTASVIVRSTTTGVNTNGFTVTLIVNPAAGPVVGFSSDTVTFVQYDNGTTLAAAQVDTVKNIGIGTLGAVSQAPPIGYTPPDTAYMSVSVTGNVVTLQPKTTALSILGYQYLNVPITAVGATNNPASIVVSVGSFVTFQKFALGGEFGCALTTIGTVWCWGDNTYGQLGNGGAVPTGNPYAIVRALLPVTTSDSAIDIVAGSQHVCALMASQTLYCWGDNSSGQLGLGTVSTTPVTRPTLIAGHTYTVIGAGTAHTCAIEGTGGANYLDCWGSNGNGQLGVRAVSPQPSPVNTGVIMQSVSGGSFNTCGLNAGQVYCWGQNTTGQLGIGTVGGNDSTPQLVTLGPVGAGVAASAVSAGVNVACAIDVNANAWCWGDNTFGELGTNSVAYSYSPIQVSSGQYTAISAGLQTVCAVATSGVTDYCWGENQMGQLANGTTTNASAPTAVSFAQGPITTSAQGNFTCFFSGNLALCAGADDKGQLGNYTSNTTANPNPGSLPNQPSSASPSRVVRRPPKLRAARRTQ